VGWDGRCSGSDASEVIRRGVLKVGFKWVRHGPATGGRHEPSESSLGDIDFIALVTPDLAGAIKFR
jgi:hypothetical protein